MRTGSRAHCFEQALHRERKNGELSTHRINELWQKNVGAMFAQFLRAGGSRSPQDLMAPLGVRLDDPAFWQNAFHVLEAEIAAFETLAASATR